MNRRNHSFVMESKLHDVKVEWIYQQPKAAGESVCGLFQCGGQLLEAAC